MSQTSIVRVCGEQSSTFVDELADEEPLEIRLTASQEGRRVTRSVAIAMRTPGQDADLAIGYLFSEGILTGSAQIADVRPCGPLVDGQRNTVRVELRPDVTVNWQRLERQGVLSSSCGVCGKTSLEALIPDGSMLPLPVGWRIAPAIVHALPHTLREAQKAFQRTGGLHASALYELDGSLRRVCEDVGRHNALDKVIGAELQLGNVPLADALLLVSGRASYELVQKAVHAGIGLLAAVGAPSSLAVALARQHHLTLLGFVRDQRFNVYTAGERLTLPVTDYDQTTN